MENANLAILLNVKNGKVMEIANLNLSALRCIIKYAKIGKMVDNVSEDRDADFYIFLKYFRLQKKRIIQNLMKVLELLLTIQWNNLKKLNKNKK